MVAQAIIGKPNTTVYYALSLGVPLYESLTQFGRMGDFTAFGDLTLRMRYPKKPSTHRPDDPIINFDHSHLYFTEDQPEIGLKVKNLGKSILKFNFYDRYYKFHQEWLESPLAKTGYGIEHIKWDSKQNLFLLNPNSETTFFIRFPYERDKAPVGIYKGEIIILSNDPVNPYLSVPFEARVK